VLHLLGHDHESPGPARRMEQLEVRLLAELGIADPYRPELRRPEPRRPEPRRPEPRRPEPRRPEPRRPEPSRPELRRA
jgi:hypothetical protein